MAEGNSRKDWGDIMGEPPRRTRSAANSRTSSSSRRGATPAGGAARTSSKSTTRAGTKPGSRTSSSPQRRSVMPGRTGTAQAGASGGRGGRGRGGSAADGGKKKSWGRRIGLGIVIAFLTMIIAGAAAFLLMYWRLQVPAADQVALAQTTNVYYNDGTTKMGTLSEINRTIIDTSTLPDYVGHAIVASEDRTFYTNSGIDLKGIARALFTNVTTGTRQGGSTLSQQYIERYYTGETTTSYVGKAKEAVLAIKINQSQSKDEILGNYMNTIYFGRGAYGIEAASQAYFGHPAAELSLSEAALLAGIIPAPSVWDPAVGPDEAHQRWQRVLDLMVEDGWVSAEEAKAAEFPTTLDPNEKKASGWEGPTGYLLQQTRDELIASGAFTAEQLETGGLQITTTIDKAKQEAAVAAAQSMNEVAGWDPAHQHVALTSLDATNGEILAEYAGADYLERQQNAATQDVAQGGSTFKVFGLLANARAGNSVMDTYNGNSPITFKGLEKPVQNYDNRSWGRQTLLQATQWSTNTPFVAMNEKIGPAQTKKAAVDAGLPEETLGLDESLLNVLGFAAPHNIDMARAYATVANGGERTSPHIVREVKDSTGATVYKATVTPERAFTAEEVSSIVPALKAVMQGGYPSAKVSKLGLNMLGKSGTSSDQLSANFAGIAPGMSTFVSMYQSDDSGASVPLTNIGGLTAFGGSDWPVDVWVKYMEVAGADLKGKDFDWVVKTQRTAQNTAPVQQEEVPQEADKPAEEQPQPAAPSTDQQGQQGSSDTGGQTGTGTGGQPGDGTGNGTGGGGTGTGNTGGGSTSPTQPDTGGGGSTQGNKPTTGQ